MHSHSLHRPPLTTPPPTRRQTDGGAPIREDVGEVMALLEAPDDISPADVSRLRAYSQEQHSRASGGSDMAPATMSELRDMAHAGREVRDAERDAVVQGGQGGAQPKLHVPLGSTERIRAVMRAFIVRRLATTRRMWS